MNHEWNPIKPLNEQERQIDLSDLDSLMVAWKEIKTRIAESSPFNLKEFNERLARQWSIETGILERIYDLDRGTTLVLIEHGFIVGLIERGSTNKEPEELIEILRDHRAAVDMIHDCIANKRLLSIGFVNELHAIITRHQVSVEGQDQFGKRVLFPLKRGAFKDQPNNPTRHDGTIHQYCPPVQVQSEMENLIRWYGKYSTHNPIHVAAWLHHRFTQIHPYQDGNGRTARALANLILIKNDLFPVVITRDDRAQYIASLEHADNGNLESLARLFADIEKKTILEALSIASDTKPAIAVFDQISDAIAEKLRKRKLEKEERLRCVNTVAQNLQTVLIEHLKSLAHKVIQQINDSADLHIGIQVLAGGPDQTHQGKPTEHWYHFQVIKSAQETNHRVNFNEHHYFVRTRLSAEGIPWLSYVISFHHIGEELSGVMEITSFAEISFPRTEEETNRVDQIKCMDKPFTITNRDDTGSLQNRFLSWATECFSIAVKQWGDIL